jgi:hypothetical protein
MYKVISASAIAAALLFAVPHAASALPGPGSEVKTTSDITQAHYKKRGYHKHRHWKQRHHYRKHRRGIHVHVN